MTSDRNSPLHIKHDRLWAALDRIEVELEYLEEQALLMPQLAAWPQEKLQAHLARLNKQRSLLLDRIAELPDEDAEEPTPDDAAANAALDQAEALLDAKKYDEARAILPPPGLGRRGSREVSARRGALWKRLPRVDHSERVSTTPGNKPSAGTAGLLDQPTSRPPRFGTVLEAATTLGVSRATLDRMRQEQRKRGWVLPRSPVQVGVGKQRKREQWDLDGVTEWAAALEEKRGEAVTRPTVTQASRRRPPRATKERARPAQDCGSAPRKGLLARAKAQVAALGKDP